MRIRQTTLVSMLGALAWACGSVAGEGLPTPVRQHNPIIPDMIADPSISQINGVFYCYATTDGYPGGLSRSGPPVVWKSKDFVHWSFSGTIFPAGFHAKYWAPSTITQRNGKFYLFPTLNGKITATVADSPEGPFHTLDGKDIYSGPEYKPFPTVGGTIDAEVFTDDDKQAYMVWQRNGIGKLNNDLSGLDGPASTVKVKRGGYSEGPFLFKRKGVYYYMYTLGGNERYQYAYMMSRTSPMGPWTAAEKDIISTTDQEKRIYGPGHGCVFSPQGTDDWYFVYLEFGRGGTTRQVWADKMEFNEDGTIKPVVLTHEGIGPLGPAQKEEANLALGAKATASSVLAELKVKPISDPTLVRTETYAAANAVDEGNGTRWMAKADDQAAWWQVDLGEIKPISRCEAYFVMPTAGTAYKLESSVDGERWQAYGGHEDVRVQSPHVDAKEVHARYLKVTVLKGTAGLWEFKVY